MAMHTALPEEPGVALRTSLSRVDGDGGADTGRPESETELGTEAPRISQLRQAILVLQLSGVNLLTSAVNGLITVGLPRIAADLALPPELYFWPASVYGLATGSALLLSGAVADILGARAVDLAGCFALGLFVLGSGLARTGSQLVAFRAVQGLAAALHLASSVGLVAAHVPRGRARNLAFSCLGLSQPLGFSLGLVVAGILVDTVGWRFGWYLAGAATLLLACAGLWALPREPAPRSWAVVLADLAYKIDWVGALLASAFMTTLSYLLAYVPSARICTLPSPGSCRGTGLSVPTSGGSARRRASSSSASARRPCRLLFSGCTGRREPAGRHLYQTPSGEMSPFRPFA